ncbi:exported hypothetical protein [Paraburkholderia piptadeniae]|uniref:Uncharacterized protein n=1 Tax=Paraburkholderia piptadeniae TaxID=1701573 RepID=A0A1N7RSG3_9BURK|nr:hypothetical protein [Paraburkholderia piptadeniae]SIT38029.1 exported hypothetical protein [Paraburkholderia piptadeniae]
MNAIDRRVIAGVAGVVCFFAIAVVGSRFYLEKRAVAHAQQVAEQLRREAAARHPDQPLSLAMAKDASAQMSAELRNEPDEKKRQFRAAAAFYGFYEANTIVRAEYCRELGVDITPFVKAFESRHVELLQKAKKLSADFPTTVEHAMELIKPQLREVTAQEIADAAAKGKMSKKQVCAFVAGHADAIASRATFAKAQPDAYAMLNDAH